MVHPALAPLPGGVQQVEERYALGGTVNLEHGVVRERMIDGTTCEHARAIALGREGALLAYLQGSKFSFCVAGVRIVVQAEPELLGHNRLGAAWAGYSGESQEPGEVFWTISPLSTGLFIPQAGCWLKAVERMTMACSPINASMRPSNGP